MYVPISGINVYNKPNGTSLGKIIQDTTRASNGEFYKVLLNLKGKKEVMKPSNFDVVDYKRMALKYEEKNSTFVKTHNGYWIKISELDKNGLRIVNQIEYLIDKSQDVLGYYAISPGLNLRRLPSTKSEVIMTLKGDLLEIKLTEEVKGLWCKVIVTEYSDHPCTSKGNFDEIKLRTFTGWIKLLSDDQIPNVTYYKGC